MLPYLCKFIYDNDNRDTAKARCDTKAETKTSEVEEIKDDKFQPASRKLFKCPYEKNAKITLVIGEMHTILYEGTQIGLMIQQENMFQTGDVCEIMIGDRVVQQVTFLEPGRFIFNWQICENNVLFDEIIRK